MANIGQQLQKRGLSDDEILRLFVEAQNDLISIIDRADAGSAFRGYRKQHVEAIDKVIARLERQLLKSVEREIPKLVKAGAQETEEIIRSFGETEFELKFAGVNEEAVRVLTEDAYLEFGNTMAALKRDASRGLINKKKIADKLVKGVIQGSSTARTQKDVVKILRDQGFTVLKAKNGFGRRFSLEHYSNMLVRTQSMTAYNLGAKSQMLGMGRRFAIFPTIRPDIDGDDICNVWERKKYIDLKKDELPPQSTHPNCRHRPVPVSFAQLKAERPDLYAIALRDFRATAG